ncbi:MAG: hypothetical protein ACO2XQ_02000 [Flavobacteriales bacterium]
MVKPSGQRAFVISDGVEVSWNWGAKGITEVNWDEWDAFHSHCGSTSVFLCSRMMRVLLRCQERPVGAVIWRKAGAIVGIACIEDSFAESVNLDDHVASERSWFNVISKLIHGRSGRFTFKVRVVGTVLGSGEHGQLWSEAIAAQDRDRWLKETIFQSVDLSGDGIPKVVMVKDQPILHNNRRQATYEGWIPLEFDPEMLFHCDPKWEGFDSYLAQLKTKARTKINRIMSLSEGLEIHPWSLDSIEREGDALIDLYRRVFERSGFRLGSLHQSELVESKRTWGDDFVVNGYYLNQQLVGFQCAYVGAEELEAFFVGFEPELLKSHAIYQRMLVEFICLGLKRKCKRVNMGRTALEIKSSVGALPRRLQCDVRFKNPLFHRIVRWYTGGYDPAKISLRQAWKADAYPLVRHSEIHSI